MAFYSTSNPDPVLLNNTKIVGSQKFQLLGQHSIYQWRYRKAQSKPRSACISYRGPISCLQRQKTKSSKRVFIIVSSPELSSAETAIFGLTGSIHAFLHNFLGLTQFNLVTYAKTTLIFFNKFSLLILYRC